MKQSESKRNNINQAGNSFVFAKLAFVLLHWQDSTSQNKRLYLTKYTRKIVGTTWKSPRTTAVSTFHQRCRQTFPMSAVREWLKNIFKNMQPTRRITTAKWLESISGLMQNKPAEIQSRETAGTMKSTKKGLNLFKNSFYYSHWGNLAGVIDWII